MVRDPWHPVAERSHGKGGDADPDPKCSPGMSPAGCSARHGYILRCCLAGVTAMKTVSAMRASMNWSPRPIATGRRRQKRLGLRSTKGRSARTPKQAISPHRMPGSRVTHVRATACGISADGRRLLFLRLNPAEPTMSRPDPNSSRSTSQKGSSSAVENVASATASSTSHSERLSHHPPQTRRRQQARRSAKRTRATSAVKLGMDEPHRGGATPAA